MPPSLASHPVELIGISKSFPGVVALADVHLALRSGHIHALVGENGAGKSTLINILSGALAPDSGIVQVLGRSVRFSHVSLARRAGIVTVHQEVDLFAELSVAENVGLLTGLPTNHLGWIDWREQRRRTQAALNAVGENMSPDTPAGRLTPAQRQMVEIAAAVSQSARVLILDEPTSSLSAAEAQTLFGHLRRFRDQGAAILYVSHRLEEVFALADDVTVLRDGRHVWHGEVANTSTSDLIQKMVGREVVKRQGDTETRRHGERKVLFRCERLTAADGTCSDVSLAVRGGEILGLYGLIGAGRTEWAQTVFGLRPMASGTVLINGAALRPRWPGSMVRRGLAYVPEDRLRQGLCRGLSVRANAALALLRELAVGPWLPATREMNVARRVVERLGVRLFALTQVIGTLSGGNQQKIVLGRWLECEPKILILDEPTRGIDVGAKDEIHAQIRALAEQGRAVILISSDLSEVLANCDRIGVFRGGRLVQTLTATGATAAEVAALALPEAVEPTAPAGAHRSKKADRAPTQMPRESALLVLILVLGSILGFRADGFLSVANLGDLAASAALLGFCAAGVAIVILAGGVDISLGSLMALSAAIAGGYWEKGVALPVVLLLAIGVGALGGALNAGVTLVGRVHPIVVTLGAMSVYRGLTLWWLERNILIPGQARNILFGEGQFLPPVLWLGAGFFVFLGVVLNRTVFGRWLVAVGGNAAAARRVGIRTSLVWLGAFSAQGALAGLAGVIYLARSGNLQPTSYEDKTLEAVAAAVVGGVAITGGRGSVLGVALGCLFLVMLGPACQFLQVSIMWQRTLVGAVLVVAVTVDALWRRRRA